MRRIALALLASVALLAAPAGGSDRAEKLAPPGPAARAALALAVGASDPAIPCRLAAKLSPSDLVAAFYRGSAAERLVAIGAAGCESDPWGVLPYLGALVGARDREVASAAAASLLRLLFERGAELARLSERVSGQAVQLAAGLAATARDGRIDTDLRGAALGAVARLQALGYRVPQQPGDLLEDPDEEIRGAALALFPLPLAEEALQALGRVATGDPDLGIRGRSAALLCENALAHDVKAPSGDLVRILKQVVGDPKTPTGPIAEVLACLRRFPEEARAGIPELALGRGDEALNAFWKSLVANP